MSTNADNLAEQSERPLPALSEVIDITVNHRNDQSGTSSGAGAGADAVADIKDTIMTVSVGEHGDNKKARKRKLAKERNELLMQERKIRSERKKIIAENKKKLAKEHKEILEELHRTDVVPMGDFPLGYPYQAAFQSSQPSFSIYRGFSYLHARVILQLQDELRCLETKLADLDADDYYSGNPRRQARVMSRDIDMEETRKEMEDAAKKKQKERDNAHDDTAEQADEVVPISKRAALLAEVHTKLLQYDEMLVKVRELAEFQRPSDRDYMTFRFWFWNKKPLSYEPEEDFIRRKGDPVSLRPRAEWGRLDGWIEARLSELPDSITKFFSEKDPQGDTRDPFVSYYSVPRIEKFTTLIIAFVIIVLLSVPVFVMYRVSWQGGRGMTLLNVGLLIIFSLFFSASMSLLTRAKRAELFAASAAYSAVLIVFIGNFAGQGEQPSNS